MAGDERLERLTSAIREAAQRALDRAHWDDAADLARELLEVDPNDRMASGMLQFALARGRTGDAEQGRRFLTVMFSDLVGSTPLSEQLDPEDYLAAIAAYQEVVRSAIGVRHGHIEQFQGDGVVAYFGYPTAGEDDQVQAIEAGLEIVRLVAVAGRDIGVELASRVGIHVGRAILTAPSLGARHQSAAIGFAANVAARIQGATRPGTVAVSEAVADFASPYFDLVNIGTPELKGVTDQVKVFEVRGPRARSTLADARLTAPLVDRHQERAAIDRAWRAACDGTDDDRLVLLVGEPGIGKSRLVRYAIERIDGPEANLLEINCGRGLRYVGLGATRESISKALGLPVPVDPVGARAAIDARAAMVGLSEASRAVLESLLGVQGPIGAVPELAPSRLREAIIGALLEWIAAEAALSPTLLVVEDVHWADDTALETIRRLTDGTLPPGLAVLLTSRAEGFPSALAARADQQLEVRPLAQDEALEMVRSLAGGAIDDEVAAVLAHRSEGVPLFTEHLVMAAAATPEDSAGDAGGDLPERMEALLQARLDATGAGRAVAEVAAVIGREFSVEVLDWTLERLGPRAPIAPEGARPALRLLERAGLVEPDGVDRMRFCHSLVRDAAYEMQLRSERPHRHRVVAEASIALRGPDAQPESLAFHHERAGDGDLAAAAHLRAAAQAADLAEFELALTHLRSALDLVSELDGPAARRLELTACMQVGAAYAASFSYFAPEGVDAYRRALDLCDLITEDEGDDPELILPLIAALGGLWSKEVVAGDMVAAGFVTDRMDRMLDKVEGVDPEIYRFSLSCRGFERVFQGETSTAIAALRTASELGHAGPISVSLGTPHDYVASTDSVLAVALTLAGDDDAADASMEEALARTRELAFPVGPFSEAVVQVYVAYLCRLRRDTDGARRAAERIAEIGDRHGFQEHSMVGQMLGLVAEAMGGDAASRQALAMTLTAWRMAGGGLAVPVLLTELAQACLLADDAEAARLALDEAAIVMEETDQRSAEPEILRLYALVEGRAGASDETVIKGLVRAASLGMQQGSLRLAARSLAGIRDTTGGVLPASAAEVAAAYLAALPASAGDDLREVAGWVSA